MMTIFSVLTLLLVGACLGSYIAARAFRIIHDKEIHSWGRSHCMHCGRTLDAIDLIPILSFLFLKGQCRGCGESISRWYVIIESLTAMLFVFFGTELLQQFLLTQDFFVLIKLLGILLFVSLLLYSSCIDIKIQAFPVVGIIAGIAINSIIAALFGIPTTFTNSLFGILFFLCIFLLFRVGGKMIFKREAFGEGDIYLGMFIGSYLGFGHSIVALYAAVFSGALYSIFILLKKNRTAAIPFAPFLCIGAVVSYFFASSIIDWYQSVFLLG